MSDIPQLAPHPYADAVIDGAPCCPFDRGHPIHRQAELPAGPLVITEGELDIEPAGALDTAGGDQVVVGADWGADETVALVVLNDDGTMTTMQASAELAEQLAGHPAAPAVVTAEGCKLCSYTLGGCSFCSGRSAIDVANERTDVAGVPVVDLTDVMEHQRRLFDGDAE